MTKDKYISPEPPPSPQEREVLECLIEECAEVQQRATKILRFGLRETQLGEDYNNSQRLSFEVGDLIEVIDLTIKRGLIEKVYIELGRKRKRDQLRKYLQTFGGLPSKGYGVYIKHVDARGCIED